MKHFESKPVKVSRPADIVYDIFSDFNNFKGLIATDRIESFTCTQTTCTIKAKGLPDITLDMKECTQGKRVVYCTHDQRPINIELGVDIDRNNDVSSQVQFFINADIEGVTSMMLSKPLQNLLDMMANKLENVG